MKRTRRVKRVRKIKTEEDGFLLRFKGKDPLDILHEFLLDRKKYVKTSYPEQAKVVLFELDLYLDTLERIIKGKVK
jgi:hypothetical protein